ncbi:MAG: Fe-S cluster assembly ATPase SufC [Armatimonadota bacterium]|nr:Fe-S cluster assembly ATPase SufC [Armatimonadota bacterium]MDR7401525.1 Fe-S cluster assembly ATPase SufC [Armatimonadota bacterium]MDR7404344.1 Fe-S cluster assembly ATPase SufC [Armatimonadota bacterium]MDR7437663.1 Fe-S cluster assembly ATPase SufC [Armatimonadota bacterium]MDR7471667.1 Fe-S cluster assembly ATPase SufC [Armatimonadota bacterium]
MADLEIRDLTVQVEDKVILKGVTLSLNRGEIHALMGPNGSGKSTLANVLMGNPFYQVVRGEVLFKGEDLLAMPPDERARKGLFIAFQYPVAIPGVTMSSFLRTAVSARRGYQKELMPVGEFQKLLRQKLQDLRIEPDIVARYVNEGFSGGEKKRAEILQMALLEPEIAILDETDSGLDIDSVKVVAEGVSRMFEQARGHLGILVITHYSRILQYIRPSQVHVMFDGRIVVSGGPELADELEQAGYEGIKAQVDVVAAEVATSGAVRRAGKVFWVAH